MSLLWSTVASIVSSIISGMAASSGGSSSSPSSSSSSSSSSPSSSSSSSPSSNQKILDDIKRVEKARGTADEEYFNRHYGGIDNYIANQQARLIAEENSPNTPYSPPSTPAPAYNNIPFDLPSNQFSLPFETQVENVRKNQGLSASDIWDSGGTTTGYEPDSWRYTGEVVALLPNNNVMVRDAKGLVLTMPRSYFEEEYGKIASPTEAQHNLTVGGAKSIYGYNYDSTTGKVTPNNAPVLSYSGTPEYYDALTTYSQKLNEYNRQFMTPEQQKYHDTTGMAEGVYGNDPYPSPLNRSVYGRYNDSFEKRDKSGAKIGVADDGRLKAVSRYLNKDIWANR